MSISEKILRAKSDVDEVYSAGVEKGKNYGGYNEGFEAGKKSQYDEFWDTFQVNGSRTNYAYGCGRGTFSKETFYPKYDIICVGGQTQMFYSFIGSRPESTETSWSLKERLDSLGVKLDTSQATSLDGSFAYGRFTELPVIDASKCQTLADIFMNCWKRLVTIEKLVITEATRFSNTFTNDTDLTNLTIEGTIGQNGFDVQWSTKLSKASWISIMTAASTTASITITGSLVSVNKAFETSEGANDGSTSPEWLALKAARPTVSVSLV